MKNILLFLFLTAFSISATAQEYISELPSVKNLPMLNSKKSLSLKNPMKDAAKVPDFSFSINPYLWAISVGGKVGIPAYAQTFDFNKKFSEAIKNLKFAFMVNGKFKYKRVSLLYDIAYINLKRFNATIPNGLNLVSANVSLKELITDLALGYSFPSKRQDIFIDAYAGARIFSTKAEITTITPTTTTSRSASKTWADPIIGTGVSFLLSPKWFSYFKSDIGGFGVNSQFTWMVLGGVGYRFSPNWNTSLGIKGLGVNYSKEAHSLTVTNYGLLLSLGYKL